MSESNRKSATTLASLLTLVERGYVPDVAIRAGIRRLCAAGLKTRGEIESLQRQCEEFRAAMAAGPIAVDTRAANEQHYELPEAFFGLCLGPHRKYSGCYWPSGVSTLADAEAASLRETCAHADLRDGQRILELGCGWGSLTLWMAKHYPRSEIVAVSNSRPQREYIERQCVERGLKNVRIITADMNEFAPPGTFDRVVSVEMFEHMRNWPALLQRIHGWLNADGRLFVHVFVHGRAPYFFETGDAAPDAVRGADMTTSARAEARGSSRQDNPADWMGRYFFTGGIMPSDHLMAYCQEHLQLEAHWRQDGTHYARTAEAWLRNLDKGRREARAIFAPVYGEANVDRWLRRWRVFFLACAEMFGFARGQEWWVSHYRLKRRP